MKYCHYLFCLITISLLFSCNNQGIETSYPAREEVVFYASFEQPAVTETRVFANENLYLRWNADDRISIFNKNTYNQQYKFLGETGDNAGEFYKVDDAEFVTGNSVDHVVSVYPYQEGTTITESEILSLTLPSEQYYAENTFGPGANTMISVTTDNMLSFRNVGGYLRISLYGENVSVSSITLKGNDCEKIAGYATISMPLSNLPSVSLSNNATSEITLTCINPVSLGSSKNEATVFWFVVPPTTFKEGFTITVKDASGGVFEKSTSHSVAIERNKLTKMAPVEVRPSMNSNVIYYTTNNNEAITLYSTNGFLEHIISNEYINGRGIITFSQNLTTIGSYAFAHCVNLTSMIIPDSVTGIGYAAFYQCSNLACVNIPSGVSIIENWLFGDCTSLTEILLPEALTTIEYCAFYGCSSLNSVIIPERTISIGEAAFYGCESLSSIVVLPDTPPVGDRMMFASTNDCPIFVPAGSVDTYKTTQYWSDYSYRIYPLSTVPVQSISLDKDRIELSIGETVSLVATVLPDNATNKNVTWTSSNTRVATVMSDGTVTSVGIGSTQISVITEAGNKTATCEVIVHPIPVTDVILNKTSLSMTVGESETLIATVLPQNATDYSMRWSSSNTSVATVSYSGVVTAKAAGNATITITVITNDEDKTATCDVIVRRIPVTDVMLNKTSLSMTVGESETLIATVLPQNATDKSVFWSSSNTSVATVSYSGVVTAKAVGNATITVMTCDGDKTATCEVTVNPEDIPVTGVSVRTSLFMNVGDTQTLLAGITPRDATDQSVTWSSSNTSIATVSASGVVTAKKLGAATISVKTNDGGYSASCALTVIDASSYIPGDKAYVGTGLEFPTADIILSQSDCYVFNVSSTIVTPLATGLYNWFVIPYGYSLSWVDNLSVEGDWMPVDKLDKDLIIIETKLYNRYMAKSVIPFYDQFKLYFVKDE